MFCISFRRQHRVYRALSNAYPHKSKHEQTISIRDKNINNTDEPPENVTTNKNCVCHAEHVKSVDTRGANEYVANISRSLELQANERNHSSSLRHRREQLHENQPCTIEWDRIAKILEMDMTPKRPYIWNNTSLNWAFSNKLQKNGQISKTHKWRREKKNRASSQNQLRRYYNSFLPFIHSVVLLCQI